jgi:mono/diheme cytochrome c family protein
MSRTGRWSTQAIVGLILLVVGVAAAVILALSIPARGPLHPGGSSSLAAGHVSGVSLGERIFLTGTDENGDLIPRSGAMGMMGSGVACANCHGPDARGRTVHMMMSQIETPDIRWSTLTAPPADPAERAFDPDSFFRAVTQGIDPEGGALKPFMPHWRLNRTQTDAVIEYLKTR